MSNLTNEQLTKRREYQRVYYKNHNKQVCLKFSVDNPDDMILFEAMRQVGAKKWVMNAYKHLKEEQQRAERGDH